MRPPVAVLQPDAPPKVPQPSAKLPASTLRRKTLVDGPGATPQRKTHHAWPRWHGGSQPYTQPKPANPPRRKTGAPRAIANRQPCHPAGSVQRKRREGIQGEGTRSPPLVARRREMLALFSVFQPPAGPWSPEGAKQNPGKANPSVPTLLAPCAQHPLAGPARGPQYLHGAPGHRSHFSLYQCTPHGLKRAWSSSTINAGYTWYRGGWLASSATRLFEST